MNVADKKQALINAGYVITQSFGGTIYVEHDDFSYGPHPHDVAITTTYDMAFPQKSAQPDAPDETFAERYARAMKGVGLS
jgi:hypothetical protein